MATLNMTFLLSVSGLRLWDLRPKNRRDTTVDKLRKFYIDQSSSREMMIVLDV